MRGAVCAVILAAMGLSGLSIGSAYRGREKLLAQMVRELQYLEEQVRIGRTVSQALHADGMDIFGRLEASVASADLQSAWENACSDAASGDLLHNIEPPERKVLSEFWSELGMLERNAQLERFAHARRALAELHAKAAVEAAGRSRLYASLGTLLGVAAVILLW